MTADSLVSFLTAGEQPVVMDRYSSALDVAEAAQDGVLLLRCTGTRGGSELTFELAAAEAGEAARAIRAGQPRFELQGTLTLNDADLQVSASIDRENLSGTARFRESQQQG
jgi:hypothetical protein